MSADIVLGVDSSTQSCKVLSVDASSGEVMATGSAPHPDGTEVDPQAWVDAFERAAGEAPRACAAVSVAGQQHGLVTIDAEGKPVRPALLWNDVRSAPQAHQLVSKYGAGYWARSTGSVPVASMTITKLAWLAEHEPASLRQTAEVVLPHDWLTGHLLGRSRDLVTDRSDASGTGYYDPSTSLYLHDLVHEVTGHSPALPAVLGPHEAAGRTVSGAVVAPGAGDNAAGAFGLELQSGEVIVSLGTSGTVFTVADSTTTDESGMVAGFADCAGGFLPLACTLNAARVLAATARLLGVDLSTLSRLALDAPADADGLLLLPYLDGERTPNLPDATGTLVGMTRSNMTAGHLARAATLGMLCGIADALDALRANGVHADSVILIGGAARSPAVRALAPAVFGMTVDVPEPG
ncbi:MAG TPA: FGGY family carbohydrate kinase, partial [Nocardioidaceae bacterium]|nr:FGGY family carbohydrate kinase [Nocardioidaceae bacterium]